MKEKYWIEYNKWIREKTLQVLSIPKNLVVENENTKLWNKLRRK